MVPFPTADPADRNARRMPAAPAEAASIAGPVFDSITNPIAGSVTAPIAWVLAALLLPFSLLLHWRLRTMLYDDAYIHLRIVRNLLAHGHAWFNPGERVMATSSPLWTALLALLQMSRWPGMLPLLEAFLLWLAVVLAARLVWTCAAARSRLVRGATAVLAGAAVLLVALMSSIGGMETPLALLLLLLAWAGGLRARAWALPVFACAAITRLEWLPLFAVAAALWWVWTRRWQPVVAGCAVLALAAGSTLWQFGVLLPNSMRAKQIGYGFTLARSLREWMNPRLRDELLVLLVLLAVGWCAWDAVSAWRHGRLTPFQALPLFAMAGALVVVAEYISRHTVIFPWYRPLVLVPLLLGLLLYRPAVAGVWMWGLRALVFGALLWPWVGPAVPALRAAVHPGIAAESRVDGGDAARVQTYLEVGEALQSACPGARLMAPEIGALGWAFSGYVYDGFGIASPGALRYQPLTSGAPRGGLPAGFVLEVRPDVVVSYQVLDVELRASPAVLEAYRLLALPTSARSVRGGGLDVGWRSSTHLDVWIKRDGGCDAGMLTDALGRRF